MDERELWDALDGLHAYDVGAVDSGIRDEALRARVRDHLRELPGDEFRLTLSRFLREHYLAEAALAQKYGAKDVAGFLDWLRNDMDIDLAS